MVHKPNYHVDEIVHWVGALKDLKAILEVGEVAIEKNAVVCKDKVEKAVERAIYILRSRQAWLLSHVDNLEKLKKHALSVQKVEVDKMLLELDQLAQLDDKDFIHADVRERYEKVIGSMQNVGWQPSEEVFLDFTANMAEFEELAINFGKVVIKDDEKEGSELTDIEIIAPMTLDETLNEDDDKWHLKSWLATPKGEAVSDEQEYEILVTEKLEESKTEENDIPMSTLYEESAHEMLIRQVTQYFKEICTADPQKWLSSPSSSAGYQDNGFGLPKVELSKSKLFSHFYQKANDYQTWLQCKKQQENFAMEDNEYIPPKTPSEEFGMWLSCKSTANNTSSMRGLKRSFSALSVSSDEKIGTVSENQWLISSADTCDIDCNDGGSIASLDTVSDISSVSKLGYINHASFSKWSDQCSLSDLTDSKSKTIQTFNSIRTSDLGLWLAPESKAKMLKPDLCVWLARFSNQRCTDCPGSCAYDVAKLSSNHKAESSLVKPELCLWLASNSYERCGDCTGSCSYDLLESVSSESVGTKKKQWLVKASDW